MNSCESCKNCKQIVHNGHVIVGPTCFCPSSKIYQELVNEDTPLCEFYEEVD